MNDDWREVAALVVETQPTCYSDVNGGWHQKAIDAFQMGCASAIRALPLTPLEKARREFYEAARLHAVALLAGDCGVDIAIEAKRYLGEFQSAYSRLLAAEAIQSAESSGAEGVKRE